METFENWTHLSPVQKDDPSHVWNAFELYLEPKSNYRLARFQLRDMRQGEREPIDIFINRLRSQAQKCKYEGGTVDDHLIDQLIKGIAHEAVRKKMLDHDPSALTLHKCVDYARTFEATSTHMQQFSQPMSVNAVHRRHQKAGTSANGKRKESDSVCNFCGRSSHPRQNCPASGQNCNKCGKTGHWGIVCKGGSRNKRKGQPYKPKAQTTNSTSCKVSAINTATEAFESLQFNTITGGNKTEAFATIDIRPYKKHLGKTTLRGKVDTGAQGNILPIRTYRKMYPNAIMDDGNPTLTQSSSKVLTAYNGSKIPQYGTLNLPLSTQ